MKWIRSTTLFLAGIAVGALLTQSIAAQNRSMGHRINHVGISVTNFDESLKFYTQVMGFMVPYCAAGGKVPEKFWVPLGTKDYSSVIAKLPQDVDAIYVALGGADAVNFLTQYQQGGGNKPLIGGSITTDQTVLAAKGRIRDALIGTPAAGPIADSWDNPKWKAFVATSSSRTRR